MTKNVFRDEIIGKTLEVVDADNKSLIGLLGKVINETKNTLVIMVDNHKKTLLKNQITFTIKIQDKRIKIDGKKITKKSEKRI